jgi:hypothetical protein
MQFTEAVISNKLQYSDSLIINDTDLNAEVSLLHTNLSWMEISRGGGEASYEFWRITSTKRPTFSITELIFFMQCELFGVDET